MQIEICTNSFQSAKIAASAGADRIELCQALELGGLTPSAGDIKMAVALKADFDFKVYVLIRSRAGDFCYTKADYELMREDVLFCKAQGVDGVVIGGLTPEGLIDKLGLQQLIDAAQGMGLTFHRAFDLAQAPLLAMEEIIDLGFERILSSGQQPTAWQGKVLLKEMVEQVGDRISIMPGSGVQVENVLELVAYTGAKAIHFSAKESVPSTYVGGGEELYDMDYWQSSRARILEMKRCLGKG